MRLQVVTQGFPVVDSVLVSATVFRDTDHSAVLQIAYDFLHGSLGNANIGCHITQAGLWITRQAHKDMTMIAKKCPVIHIIVTGKRILGELYFVFTNSAIIQFVITNGVQHQ